MSEQNAICPICKSELPVFTESGNHNFVPHIKEGKLIQICIACKSEIERRRWQSENQVVH